MSTTLIIEMSMIIVTIIIIIVAITSACDCDDIGNIGGGVVVHIYIRGK